MGRSLVALVLLAGIASAVPARADDINLARELFQKGAAALSAGRFDEAITNFEAAYQAKPAPSLFFYMGDAHRQAGHTAIAVDYFHRYVDALPNGPRRADAETRLAELKPQKETSAKRRMTLDAMDLEPGQATTRPAVPAAKEPPAAIAAAAREPAKAGAAPLPAPAPAAVAALPAPNRAAAELPTRGARAAEPPLEKAVAEATARPAAKPAAEAAPARAAPDKSAAAERAVATSAAAVEPAVAKSAAAAPVLVKTPAPDRATPKAAVAATARGAAELAAAKAATHPAAAPLTPAAAAPVKGTAKAAPAEVAGKPAMPAPRQVAAAAPARTAANEEQRRVLPAAPAAALSAAAEPRRFRAASLTLGAVGLLAAGGAAVFSLQAVAASNDVSNAAASGAPFDPARESAGKRAQTLSFALYGVAGASLATSAILWIVGSGSSAPVAAADPPSGSRVALGAGAATVKF